MFWKQIVLQNKIGLLIGYSLKLPVFFFVSDDAIADKRPLKNKNK